MADRDGGGKLEDVNSEWESIVIGAGAAGLSAALVLGRARRRTLVVDAGRQSNLAAHGIGGLLGFDGAAPADLYAAGRAELQKYPTVEFLHGEVVTAETGFTLTLADDSTVTARTVLLATGMDYRTADIPGLDAAWGGSVFHCPFCHGWELRDEPLAVVGRGERAMHSALMLRGWTDDLMVASNGPAELDDDARAALARAGVAVDERPIARFVCDAGELTALEFADCSRVPRRGALVTTTLQPRSTLAAQLGVATTDTPMGTGVIVVDEFQRTTVPGVFAAGDVSPKMPQVAAAMAAGSLAGAAMVQTLLADEVGLPVPAWPNQKENERVNA